MSKYLVIVIMCCLAGCGTSRKPIVQVDNNRRVAINSESESEKIWQLAGYDEYSVIVDRAEAETARKEADRARREGQNLPTDSELARLRALRQTEQLISVEQWQRSILPSTQVFYFDSGVSRLTIDDKSANQIMLLIDRATGIDIRGRTDGVGADEGNDQLALKRATAAKQYLMNLGVAERMISLNYSAENNYVANESSSKARSRNRRVEMEFILEPVRVTVNKRNLN